VLEYRANTDALTDLPNRRSFHAQSQTEFDVLLRLESPMSLIVIDIDCFKAVNDLYGHDAGDRVLQQVAASIRSMCAPNYYPVRWGGDEFAMLLPGCDLKQARAVAERLRANIEGMGERINGATVSIGIALYHEGDTLGTLFKRADRGLYRAKSLGRNRAEASPDQAYSEDAGELRHLTPTPPY
jgi:diguanylate cyclase (GGDEF)-like protein